MAISETQPSDTPVEPQLATQLLTVFTVVKSFDGKADIHQRNALASWKSLGPQTRVIVFHDSELPADIEASFECHTIEMTNDEGTPLLDDVFSRTSLLANSPYLAYVNADILLDQKFVDAIKRLAVSHPEPFLAFGRRMDLDVNDSIEFTAPDWIESFLSETRSDVRTASIVCKDYFLFSQGLFEQIPAFAVGRGNWDNWMVHHAKAVGISVIDMSDQVVVLHQNHEYQHVSGGRYAAYVNGKEARANQRLAKGRNLVGGSTANWKLTDNGIEPESPGNWPFWLDSMNFLRLMRNLLFSRR